MILDVHLHSNTSKYEWEDGWILNPMKFSEEKICKRKVSVDTLVYFWSYWKDQIVNIFKFLGYLETHQYDIDCYGDFCLNYLGVLKQCKSHYNLDSFYHLLKCDANWVGQLDDGYVTRNGNLVSIDVHCLVSAARSYWSAELLSVGMKVLDNLEVLYKLSMKNSTSVFCQIMSLTYVYEVGKFLLDSRCLHRQFSDAKKLQKFLELSTCNFFGYIFPLDWRESLRENMIYLRGTEAYKSILQEVIFQCIGLKKKLSFGQIGRVAVMIFRSGKLQNELYQQVVKKCDGNSPWKAFLESLCAKMVLESQQGSAPCNRDILLSEVSLVQKFHGALLDTYEANWREEHDYISPDCFLYLIERLVLMLSCFQGCVLSTKSSFVDWLVHLDGRTEPISFLQADGRQSIGHVLESVTRIVQLLLYNKGDTLQWIRKCLTNDVNGYSLVVLRLGREHNFLDLNVFAEAFKKIDNPLVIVSLVKGCPNFTSPGAILVDMMTSQSKEDILGILFPKNEEFQSHAGAAEADSASLADQDMNSHNINEDKMEMNLIRQFWKIFEALNLVDKEKGQKSIVLDATSIKVDVKKIIRLLIAVMDGFIQKNPFDRDDKRQFDKAVGMLEELKQLYAFLDVSELELENNVSTIEELLRRLQSRRQTMEPLWNRVFLQQPSNLEGKESKTGMASGSKSDEENSDSSKAAESWIGSNKKLSVVVSPSAAQVLSIKDLEMNMKAVIHITQIELTAGSEPESNRPETGVTSTGTAAVY
ncbi:hypothetical protein LWI29_022009 [Acer saccharum]|uniref:Uncharacterized protein n=1 Tax=Acer saccharum TaxID=4024 RepID=A0AA39RK51_ACESA|nr:hypothetical protein LWI29_022009 [Acer saccharum]